MQKNITESPRNSDRHEFDTRFKNKLAIQRFRLQKVNASFMGQGVSLYNEIPGEITSLALNKFKSSIKRILLKFRRHKGNKRKLLGSIKNEDPRAPRVGFA